MPYPNSSLQEHRRNLSLNPDIFSEDKERAVKNWANKSWCYCSKRTDKKKREVIPILLDLAEMVWEAQDGKPLFHFYSSDGLPMSWNIPSAGDKSYIKYEIGHIKPVNIGGDEHPENLCFQSGRCNRHIQSSLCIDEVMYYFKNNDEVLNRVDNFFQLHETESWINTIEKIGI